MKKDSKTYLLHLAEAEMEFHSQQYCDESGEFKVIYETYEKALQKKRTMPVPLRIYPCKGTGHYHFTSNI